jgi:hypothetical protein
LVGGLSAAGSERSGIGFGGMRTSSSDCMDVRDDESEASGIGAGTGDAWSKMVRRNSRRDRRRSDSARGPQLILSPAGIQNSAKPNGDDAWFLKAI